jgi:hypothetical protein
LFAFVAQTDQEEQASRHLMDFLNSERVCARTDDDKSLVLAVRVLDLEIEPESEETESELQTLTGDLRMRVDFEQNG